MSGEEGIRYPAGFWPIVVVFVVVFLTVWISNLNNYINSAVRAEFEIVSNIRVCILLARMSKMSIKCARI